MKHEETIQEAANLVREYWQEAACGERLLLHSLDRDGFEKQAAERYRLEPYIQDFAKFDEWQGKHVLEVGVGLGADHQRFVDSGAITTGVDLTQRAIELTKYRLREFGLESDLRVADAANLSLSENQFDLVYSWGVIHHSPNTEKITREVFKVLKPGGVARVMIYSKFSIVGFMLWFRYALLRLRPFTSFRKIYSTHLESPGTKAYTINEAKGLFKEFTNVTISTVLTHGDLLTSSAGQRHEGILLSVARIVWPRWFISRFLAGRGLFMMIEAKKPIS